MAQTPLPLVCLILAAGQSQRLGRNKCELRIQNKPLLVHTVLKACSIAPTYVALGCYAESNHRILQQYCSSASALFCQRWSHGMGATIAESVQQLPTSEGVLIFLADQYAVSKRDLKQLVRVWRGAPDQQACAKYDNGLGVPAIFPASRLPNLLQIDPSAGAKSLLDPKRTQTLDMPNAALDIDTPQDYADLATNVVDGGLSPNKGAKHAHP